MANPTRIRVYDTQIALDRTVLYFPFARIESGVNQYYPPFRIWVKVTSGVHEEDLSAISIADFPFERNYILRYEPDAQPFDAIRDDRVFIVSSIEELQRRRWLTINCNQATSRNRNPENNIVPRDSADAN